MLTADRCSVGVLLPLTLEIDSDVLQRCGEGGLVEVP